MRDDLMAEEIEIDPVIARAAFGAAEQVAVKGARFGKIAHRKRHMEAWTL